MPHNKPNSSTIRHYFVASRAATGPSLAVQRAVLPFGFYETVEQPPELTGENHNHISRLEGGLQFGGGVLAFRQKARQGLDEAQRKEPVAMGTSC